ncbi:MAG: LysM peptidoglycan-binding domain-containing protein [Acidimicrobiales bacterium]|nr:LysM peptidoglycan-binding domain-containing protein [Acidimicrobiales bacterium]
MEPQPIDLPPQRRGPAALLAVAALVGTLLIAAVPAAADTVITVEAGDSLSEIALAHGTTVAALMAANGITDPDRVYMGQRLVVPGPGSTPTTLPTMVVVVQRGDSLSGIAAEYGVTLSALIEANNISDPDTVHVGQELLVPGATRPITPTGPVVVIVQSGDSLSAIAAEQGVSVSALMNANGITNPDLLSIGQQLVIPGRFAPPVYSIEYGPVVVDGRGWGHGRGMGQYGALGYALDEGWGRDQILDHYYGGTVPAVVPDVEIGIRLLSHDSERTTAYLSNGVLLVGGLMGPWTVVDAKVVRLVLDGDIDQYRVQQGSSCGGGFTDTGLLIESPVARIAPAWPIGSAPSSTGGVASTTDGVSYQLVDTATAGLDQTLQLCESATSSTWYRGEIRAARYGARQRTVNWVAVEQYLRSVVPSEMPSEWSGMGDGAGQAALEVQAVAARSYALAEVRYDYAKTCDTIRCQVYSGRRSRSGSNGWDHETSATDAAVTATAGMVRLLDGVVSRTEFSASTGGHTFSADFVGVPDTGDDVSINPVHRWTDQIDATRVADTFGLGPLYEIEVIGRDGYGDDGGRAVEVELRARDGNRFVVSGDRFRREFGLRSNWFGIAYGPPNAGTSFPDPQVDEYRVTSAYAADDLVLIEEAADHLQMTVPEFQRAGVWVVAFLHSLSSSDPDPINPPEAAGPEKVTTAYFAADGDQQALEQVAAGFSLTGAQAQQVSTAVLAFLVGLAKAAGR